MKRQQESSAAAHQQGDPQSPSSPGAVSVWVSTGVPSQDTCGTSSKISTGSTGNMEFARQLSGSSADGQYVLVSVKDSTSSSESSSRKSSEVGCEPHPSAVNAPGVVHSRSSSNSSSIDPFTPTSPQGISPIVNGQNVSLAGNALGLHQNVSNGNDLQNLGNFGTAGSSVSPGNTNGISNSALIGNSGIGPNATLAGGTLQNTVFFPNTGNLSNVTLAGNTSNLFAANPGQMIDSSNLLYNGAAFLPAATSSMGVLPQAGYDPGSLLFQQQYALNPDLLAASLSLSAGQNLNQLQTLASLGQGQTMNLPTTQPTAQDLSLLQAQASLSQAQPMPQNLNLLQAQALLQNLSLSQAEGTAQNLQFSQVQNPGLAQAQSNPQSPPVLQPQTSAPQSADLQRLQLPLSSAYPAADGLQSPEVQAPSYPHMGHSFDVLLAIVATNQAALSNPVSPTSPSLSPQAVSPQHLPLGGIPGLPPSLTGLTPSNSVDLVGNHEVPQAQTEGPPDPTLHTSSSLDNGDDQATSGMGSSVPSTPSDSNPTSPNADLHSLTFQDEKNVQLVEPQYDRPSDKSACLRCGKKVYTMEKVGPVKDVLYHKTCFTCVVCHTQLNLKNFHLNDADLADLNVFCASHKPAVRARPLDASALGIKRALTAPKQGRVNEQIRGGPEARSIHVDSQSVSIRSALHVPAPDLQASIKQREGAWFREERKYEPMPPQDVVRHDEQNEQYQGSRSLYLDPT